jgi:hypothetical protein
MAKRLAVPFKEMQLRVVGPTGEFKASRIQKLDINANIPSTDVDELGNNLHAGVVTGTPEVTATFSAMDVSVKIFAALTGTDATAYPAQGVSISQLGEVDIVGQVKDAKLADYIKSVHGRRLQITGFNYTYNVTGESTEEYTAQGSEKRWFKNDITVDKFATGTTSFTLTETPIQLKNGNYALSAILDGVYLDEVSGAPATGQYRVVGTTLTTGDSRNSQLVVVYHTNPAGTNWTYISDSMIPAAVRGKNVPVLIGVNNIQRVQSVTIRGNFPNQKIEEMGNTSVVGYTTMPAQVTGDLTVLDTDLELIALLQTGSLNPADTEFPLCGYTVSGLSLELQIQDPTNTCTPSGLGVLKTVYIPQISITSEGHSTNVGNNAQQTFGFKSVDGNLIVYSGMRS